MCIRDRSYLATPRNEGSTRGGLSFPPRHYSPAPPTPPNHLRERNPMDPITTQLTIHQILDVIWPILPPHILEQLAYV